MMADSDDKASVTPQPAVDIAAREQQILGKPPRIAALDRDETADMAMEWWMKLRKYISGTDEPPPPGAQIPEIYFYMLRVPELWDRFTAFSIQLQAYGALTFRDRELAILRTGWLCQAPFEWGEHVIKSRDRGFTSEDIERIAAGSSAPGWSEHERAILRAVEELHADSMISDDTWGTLAKTLTEEQLLELPFVVGQFVTVGYFQNALRIPLTGGNVGLKAR